MAIEMAISLVTKKLEKIRVSEQFNFDSLHDQVGESVKRLEGIKEPLANYEQGSWRSGKWAIKLLKALYEADDALEIFFFEIAMKQKGFVNVFPSCRLRSLCNFLSREMKVFLEKLDEVKNDQPESSQKDEQMQAPSLESTGDDVQQNSEVQLEEQERKSDGEPDTYNMEKISPELAEKFLSHDSSLLLISLVGAVSSGKRNLLQDTYDSTDMKKHFDISAWVDTPRGSGHKFQKKLLKHLSNKLKDVAGIKETMKLKVLQKKLKHFLLEKRYLIVLYDLPEPDVWNSIKFLFPNSFNGSRVILSFCKAGVAQLPDSRFPGTVCKSLVSNGINVSGPDEEVDMVGREAERKRLAQLTSGNEFGFLVTVLGKAGSGKSTLVKNFYNNLYVKQNFECQAWVCVSKIFNVENLLVEMLEQLTQEKDKQKWPLKKFLAQKKYLIVLDDVQTADVWEELKKALPNSFNGSRVILTVRDESVAHQIDQSAPVQLDPLSDDESWTLFLKKVKKDKDDENLKNFKEKVLQKCCGLPLAIVWLGGFLSDKEYPEWPEAIENISVIEQEEKRRAEITEQMRKIEGKNQRKKPTEKEEIEDNEHQQQGPEAEGVLDDNRSTSRTQSASSDELGPSSILALSYQKFSPSLRACLSYLCLFPKSEKISVRRLSLLWLAEGLVQPSETETSGDVVKKYLQELEKLNMIEVTRRWFDEEPKTCHVMSTVYDRFFNIAQKTGFFSVLLKPNSESGTPNSSCIYRLIQYSNTDKKSLQDAKIQHLRTYISFDRRKGDKPADTVCKLLKKTITRRGYGLVRALDLEGVYKPELSETLRKLPLLKYVGLRRTFLDSVPESIGDLQHLETLDVKHTGITMLPTNLWKSKTLQHLYMDGIHIEMKDGSPCIVGSLSNLQTLWGLVIGNESPTMEWLTKLMNLRKLGLTCHTTPLMKMLSNWIDQLKCLKSLKLRSRCEDREDSNSNLKFMYRFSELTDLYLLGKLPPSFISIDTLPPNLKILTLSLSQLSDDPMEVLGQLKHLSVLRLCAHSYNGNKMRCLHGGFPKLRLLRLWMLMGLERWTIEEEAMPLLTELEIRCCQQLKKPNGLEKVKSLNKVTFTNMKQAFVDELKESMGIYVEKRDLEFKPSWD